MRDRVLNRGRDRFIKSMWNVLISNRYYLCSPSLKRVLEELRQYSFGTSPDTDLIYKIHADLDRFGEDAIADVKAPNWRIWKS